MEVNRRFHLACRSSCEYLPLRRSTGIGNDRRLHFLAVRFRMSLHGALVGSFAQVLICGIAAQSIKGGAATSPDDDVPPTTKGTFLDNNPSRVLKPNDNVPMSAQ